MTKVPSPFASIGVDIGKEAFHLVGFDSEGVVVLRRKIKRSALVHEFEKLPPTNRRYGSLPERPLRQPHLAPARA
jgi:hypothetical protein